MTQPDPRIDRAARAIFKSQYPDGRWESNYQRAWWIKHAAAGLAAADAVDPRVAELAVARRTLIEIRALIADEYTDERGNAWISSDQVEAILDAAEVAR